MGEKKGRSQRKIRRKRVRGKAVEAHEIFC